MDHFAFTTASGELCVLPFPMALPFAEREQYMADAIAAAEAPVVLDAPADSTTDED
jgi:hypothetical protein